VTIAINPTLGACAHPLGLSYSELRTLDSGGSIPMGSISLLRARIQSAPPTPVDDSLAAFGTFAMEGALQIMRIAQPQEPASTGCSIPPVATASIGTVFGDGGDAGNQLTLSGPGGAKIDMPPTPGGYYYGSNVAALVPGAWQVSAPGGQSVAAFEQPFTLPPLPQTNTNQILMLPGGDLSIAWDPQGYSVSDIMTVALGSFSPSYAFFIPEVSCTAHATAGRVVVPSALLNSAVASNSDTVSFSVSPFPVARVRFSAPLATGGSMPVIIDYSFWQIQPLTLP